MSFNKLLSKTCVLVGAGMLLFIVGCQTQSKDDNILISNLIKDAAKVKSRGMPIPELYDKDLPVLEVEEKAPDFSFEDIKGNSYSLSDFNGKVVILDFTATWCGMTFDERDAFEQLKEKYKDSLIIISIDTYQLDSNEDFKKYVKIYGGNWIHLVDKDTKIASMYGVKQTVTTFMIDKNGFITYKDNWITSLETLESELSKILGYTITKK